MLVRMGIAVPWNGYQIPRPMSVILSASHPNSPIAMSVSRLTVESDLSLGFSV